MRAFPAGFDEKLRCNQPRSRVFPESIVTTLDDIKQRKDQWEAADDTTGFELLENGTVRLLASDATKLELTTSDDEWEAIDGRNAFVGGGEFNCAKVVWGGNESRHMQIQDVRAYLNPNVSGGGAQVAFWECHLFVGNSLSGDTGSALTLTPITDGVRVVAPQTAGDVTFDFSGRVSRPTPKLFDTGMEGGPHMYVVIFALTATGGFAGNVGWAIDTGETDVTTDGNILTGVVLESFPDGEPPRGLVSENPANPAGVPRCRIRTGTVAADTLEFTDPANRLDLGGTPTGTVELSVKAETPGDSTVTYEIRDPDDGGSPGPWTEFVDGDTIADLGLALRDDYDFRVTFTPDAGDAVSPVLVLVGIAELERESFAYLATVEGDQGQWDPATGATRIPQAVMKAILDGEGRAPDYEAAIYNLLANHDKSDIQIRAWVGDPEDDRSTWGLIAVYDIDDWEHVGPNIELLLVSPSKRLLTQILPILDGSDEQEPLVYENELAADVYEDIIDTQVGLPTRWRGPGIVDATTRIGKQISNSNAWAELQRICWLLGKAVIESQGQIKVVDMFGEKAVRQMVLGSNGWAMVQTADVSAAVGSSDVKWGRMSPGYRFAVPEYFVPYDFSYSEARFRRKTQAFHADALLKLNVGAEAGQELEAGTAQWITSTPVTSVVRAGGTVTVTTDDDHGLVDNETISLLGALEPEYNGDHVVTVTGSDTFTFPIGTTPTSPATGTIVCSILSHRVANRVVRHMGPGLMLLPVEMQYPHPEWEIGDLIAAQTDRLILRDPSTDRAIRGLVVVRGVIVEGLDRIGKRFMLWVRSPSDIVSGTAAATLLGFAVPEVLSAQLYGDEGGDGVITGEVGAKGAQSVRWAVSNADYPDRATTQAGTLEEVTADGNAFLGTIDTLSNGETAYVSILAYENLDGTGAESVLLVQKRITRRAAETKTRWVAHSEFVTPDASEPTYVGDVVHVTGYMYPNTPSGTSFFANASCSLVFPVGSRIDEVIVEGYTDGSIAGPVFSLVSVELRRITSSATVTSIATAVRESAGPLWAESSDACNEPVDDGDSYVLFAALRAVATGGVGNAENARLSRAGITYTSPSYYETN